MIIVNEITDIEKEDMTMTHNMTVLPWVAFVFRNNQVKFKLFRTRAAARTFAKVAKCDENVTRTIVTRANSSYAKRFYGLRHVPNIVDTKARPVLVLAPTVESVKVEKKVTRNYKAQTDFPLFTSLG